MKRVAIISMVFMTLMIIALVVVIAVRPGQQPPRRDGKPRHEAVSKRAIEGFQEEQIAEILGLEGERYEQFKALYKEYAEATKPEPRSRSPFNKPSKMDRMTDEEIDKSIKRSFTRSKRAIKVKASYYERFKEILSPSEIAMMYEIERRTHERFIDEVQQRAR